MMTVLTSSWVVMYLLRQMSALKAWVMNCIFESLCMLSNAQIKNKPGYEKMHNIQESNKEENLTLIYHFRVRKLIRKAVPMITKMHVLTIRAGRTGRDVSAR